MPIDTAILGASGYGGAELLRLLSGHPHFKPVCLVAHSQAGQKVGGLYPHLRSWSEMTFQRLDDCREALDSCPLVFCGLPHGEAMRILPALKSEVIIDLGGDFRLDDAVVYEEWYNLKHECPDKMSVWVYGLPELFRRQIKDASRIANPGCYATAAILAAAPLVREGMYEGPLVIDAISGVSGAGRVPKPEMHFAHVDEDLRAYKVGRHQHTPEIEMALARICGKPVIVSFTPHLAPAVRGIHLTLSAALPKAVDVDDILELYRKAYQDEPFVRVGEGSCGTKDVRGSNFVSIAPTIDPRAGRVIVCCVIDNLVKGAAGQALQNANIRFGYSETLGLEAQGLYP